jgi:hypothetical protein
MKIESNKQYRALVQCHRFDSDFRKDPGSDDPRNFYIPEGEICTVSSVFFAENSVDNQGFVMLKTENVERSIPLLIFLNCFTEVV